MMLFALERITQPESEPVTLAEAKQQCRVVDYPGSPTPAHPDDAQLTSLIVSAREWAEEFTGRALVEQSWRLTIYSQELAVAPGDTETAITGIYQFGRYGEIMLHKSPVIAITSFVTVDSTGVETAVGVGSPLEATYELREGNSKFPRIVSIDGQPWSSDTQKIEFRAGYAARMGSPDPDPDLTQVPARFKQAILFHVEAHYDRDEKMMEILLKAAENLIRPERVELGFA